MTLKDSSQALNSCSVCSAMKGGGGGGGGGGVSGGRGREKGGRME